MNPEPQLRRGLLTRTLFEILRDTGVALAPRDAIARVKDQVQPNERELSRNDSGFPRFETYLRWVSSWSSAIGWMAKRGGWSITEAGVEALDECPGDELAVQLTRRYRQQRKQKQQKHRPSGYRDPRWVQVVEALTYVEAGWWTTYGDLANLTGLSAQSIGRFLREEKVDNPHRVLRSDGTIAPDFHWPDPIRSDDPRQLLEKEGVRFDEAGRADFDQRLTTASLREQLEELDGGENGSPRRAWLVRGSSVDGENLVHTWLHEEWISLAAASLRPVQPPVPLDELRDAVEQGYRHRSYAAREAKVTEFDAFCNRMRVGDYLLTTSQGATYLGRIAGEATYTSSTDQRSNLRRKVEWLNPGRAVVFSRLPPPLPAKMHSQADVVDLTDEITVIKSLLDTLGITEQPAVGAPGRELRFREVGQDFADQLLIDRGWLQQQADLLWERKQIILHGPPGTGKTFLARELANHLAEPGAVKLVQFHPSYTYEDFFEGFRPAQREDGQLSFALQHGPFRRLVEAARDHPADPYILIIDEINRANLAKVFGELYFLLEYRNEAVDLLYSPESEFIMPVNVFLIGTMNTTDRSIGLLDAAMRRRFAFVELHPAHPPTKGLLAAWLQRLEKEEDPQHNLDAAELLAALNARIDDHELAIGPSYLMHRQIYHHENGLERVWQTSLLPLLAEHHYGAPPAVLDKYRLDALRSALAERRRDNEEPT